MKAPVGWSMAHLRDVATVQTGLAKGKPASEGATSVPYLRVANVQDGYVALANVTNIDVTPTQVRRYELRSGDVLFTEGGDFNKLGRGTVWRGQISPCLHQNHVFAVRPDADKLLPGFLAALAASTHGRRYFQSASKQSTNLASINSTQLKTFPVLLPPLSEQRQIAEILRTWDDAIDAHEGLRSRAKRVNSSIAAASFAPVHADSGDLTAGWNAWKLGDLFSERSEAGDPSLPLLSVTQVNGVVAQESTGRKNSANADRSKYKLVLPDDVAYNTMRMWQGASGVVQTAGVISPAYTVVVPDVARVSPQFLAHLFKSPRMMFDFERYSQGLTSDTWNLKYPAFAGIRVNFPSLDQQRRIADVLDQLKRLESLHASAAELLRTQKRGLMQKLLTGQVRVKVAAGTEPGGLSDD
jgi:type I restriction enzyme S subunit